MEALPMLGNLFAHIVAFFLLAAFVFERVMFLQERSLCRAANAAWEFEGRAETFVAHGTRIASLSERSARNDEGVLGTPYTETQSSSPWDTLS